MPKWDYLTKVCLYPTFELSAFPAFFSYPLDRVIRTRFEYLEKVKRTPTQLLALDVVLRYGDRDFAIHVARDEDNGAAFLEFVGSRNKPNSGTKGKEAKKRSANRQPVRRKPPTSEGSSEREL
jgi:hypothetical protein